MACPQDNTNRKWNPEHDEHGNPIITIWFDEALCTPCPVRARRTAAQQTPVI